MSASQLRPLIVEWPSPDRAALETLAQHGVVAVHYEGCEMEVLRQCRAGGKYKYTSTTSKHDRVRIRDEDDLYAHLPFGAAKLEGTLKRAGELNVTMTIVGTYEADQDSYARDTLQGDCARATHVIAALTVGAFDFFAGSSADAHGGVDVAGAGAGGGTSTKQEMLNEDGDERACENAKRGADAPPEKCGALLRLEVVPIGAAIAKNAPPVCRDEIADCTAKCDAGSAESCTKLARAYLYDLDVPFDPARAGQLLQKACDGGSFYACVQMGELLRQPGTATEPAFVRPAAPFMTFFERAFAIATRQCEVGDADACQRATSMRSGGLGIDANKEEQKKFALRELELRLKGCEGERPDDCVRAAAIVNVGNHVRTAGYNLVTQFDDVPRARALLKRGCEKKSRASCKALAQWLFVAVRDGVDGATASDEAQAWSDACSLGSYGGEDCGDSYAACRAGDTVACIDQARDQQKRGGLRAALSFYERACSLAWRSNNVSNAAEEGCSVALESYKNPKEETHDGSRALDLARRECFMQTSSCDDAGALYEKGDGVKQDMAKAIAYYKIDCSDSGWCDDMVRLNVNGIGMPKNWLFAFGVQQRICRTESSGVEEARAKRCVGAARLVAQGGNGLDKDVKRARELATLACDKLKSKEACDLVAKLPK